MTIFSQLHFKSEEEDNHYDGVGPSEVSGESIDSSGAMNEDVRSVRMNSHYGVDISMDTSRDQEADGNNESNEMERIKSTRNVYYEM